MNIVENRYVYIFTFNYLKLIDKIEGFVEFIFLFNVLNPYLKYINFKFKIDEKFSSILNTFNTN